MNEFENTQSETIAHYLDTVRDAKGLSKTQLGVKLGVSKVMAHLYCKKLSYANLVKLLTKLGWEIPQFETILGIVTRRKVGFGVDSRFGIFAYKDPNLALIENVDGSLSVVNAMTGEEKAKYVKVEGDDIPNNV